MANGEWRVVSGTEGDRSTRYSPLAIRPPASTPAEFDSILRRARASGDSREQARQAAEEFVAQVLVLPVLKSIREQNQAAPPFAPGPYERSIGALFDMEVASRMVRAQRFSIVDAVARNLLREERTTPASAGSSEQGGSNHGPIGPSEARNSREAQPSRLAG